MATKLPYVNQPGSMIKILEKVKSAKTPDRFTYDFLETVLGFKGGNARQFVSLAKKLALLGSDGAPTELYRSFRNADSSSAAIASALRHGYKEVFARNEYANRLDAQRLKGLVVEITGLESESRVVQLVCQTFNKLKSMADFEADLVDSSSGADIDQDGSEAIGERIVRQVDVPIGLSYTINLVLPKTDDPAVFNAIFRSLRENLLRT